jgi:alpha-amylase
MRFDIRLALPLLTLGACAPPGDFLVDPRITNHVDDWRDEVVYQVITDRFANGDRNNDFGVTQDRTNLNNYMGGDWQGLIDRVDYLSELGVTTIWISPVVRNVEEDAGIAGYHGYWTQSFVDTNPHMGDLAKLRELVQVMHDNDIKVVVDVVVNHVGQLFYYDINQNGQPDVQTLYATDGSAELDIVTEWDPQYDSRRIQSFTSLGEAGDAPIAWVDMPEINRVPPEPAEFHNDAWYNRMGRVSDWNTFEQVVQGDFPGGLKDLRTENPNVRAAVTRVFQDWITRTNIDGFRVDTVKHVEEDFWREWAPAIRSHAADLGKEKFLLYGEVFDGNDALVGAYTQADMLDGNVDFAAKYQVFQGVFKDGAPTSTVSDLYEARQVNWGAEPQPGGVDVAPRDLPLGFIDNHDVARFQWQQEDDTALRMALVHLFTREGLPVLYYGTEQGFDGGNDPANREALWWSGYDRDHPLYRWISALTTIRADHAPLRRGTVDYVWTTDHTGDEQDAGILAYERVNEGENVVVVINTHATKTSSTGADGVTMTVSAASGTTFRDVLPSDAARSFTVQSGGELLVELGPREAVILVEGG